MYHYIIWFKLKEINMHTLLITTTTIVNDVQIQPWPSMLQDV